MGKKLKEKADLTALSAYLTVRITPEAQSTLSRLDIKTAAGRNAACDWGSVTEDEWIRNDEAYKTGGETVARYVSAKGKTFLCISASGESAPRVSMPGSLKRAW